MSWKYTAAVMEMDLPTNEKIVLLALAHRKHYQTGKCYPSRSGLSKLTGLSGSTVKVQLDALVVRGLVTRIESTGRRSNSYLLNFEPHKSQKRAPTHRLSAG